LGGPNSNGIAINNLGQVAGSSNTSDGSLRAFRYSGSTITDLKSVYGISNGSGINDAGLVVGGSEYRGWTYANEWHAFLWQAGKIADLNQQLPRGSAWTLEVAYDINKDGRIVGSMLVSGQRHAFMMVPSGVSTPLTVAAAPASTTFSAVPITEGASEVLAADGATVLR